MELPREFTKSLGAIFDDLAQRNRPQGEAHGCAESNPLARQAPWMARVYPLAPPILSLDKRHGLKM